MSKVYQYVNEKIVQKLKDGVIPWEKPWAGAQAEPRNLQTGKTYRGINPFLLASEGRRSRWWMTYNQAKALGGNVKKGEHGALVIFWRMIEASNKAAVAGEDEETKAVPMLRYYKVFNLDQTEDVRIPKGRDDDVVDNPDAMEPAEAADWVIEAYIGNGGPVLANEGGGRACYSPAADRVNMPIRTSFRSAADWYNTLFHELGHSTGHESRLKRKEVMSPDFGRGEEYGVEELVAEFTAAFLCGHTGVARKQTEENNAAYIKGWLKAISDDKKVLVNAAARAQRSADLILEKSEVSDA